MLLVLLPTGVEAMLLDQGRGTVSVLNLTTAAGSDLCPGLIRESVSQGIHQGINQDMSQGMSRDMHHHMSQGMNQGMSQGVMREGLHRATALLIVTALCHQHQHWALTCTTGATLLR